MSDKLNLRSSSLGTYSDCLCRGFANSFRKKIFELGFVLNDQNYNISAALGTAAHEGAKIDLIAIKDGKDRPSMADVEAASMATLDDKIQIETQYDGSTPNYNTAQKQLAAIVKSHYLKVAPLSDPLYVEKRLWCNVGDKIILTGQPDEISRSMVIKDIKTGAKKSYIFQLGGYGILAEAQGLEIDGAEIIGLPRPKRGGVVEIYKENISGEVMHHGAIPATFSLLNTICDKYDALEAGDQILDVNPSSSMCSRRMCPAYGTNFCIATCGK